ncbi:hypothetical protein BH09MYX1_BH09MYX1_62850 [soil metagenome]
MRAKPSSKITKPTKPVRPARRARPGSTPPRTGEARERILTVASRMLREVGPDGLRLQEIAREVGVSHPAILHHFTNRAGLVRAVVERALNALEDDVARALAAGEAEKDPVAILESCFRALSDHRYGRLIAWLALAEMDERRVMSRIGAVVELMHGVRSRTLAEKGLPCPPIEDTSNVVMLASFALLGDSICGHLLRQAMPQQKSDPKGERFRRWLADRLVAHLESPKA